MPVRPSRGAGRPLASLQTKKDDAGLLLHLGKLHVLTTTPEALHEAGVEDAEQHAPHPREDGIPK